MTPHRHRQVEVQARHQGLFRSGYHRRPSCVCRHQPGGRQPQLRPGCEGLRRALWRGLCRRLHRHHDRWRHPAMASAPGPSLLLPRHGHKQVSRSARTLQRRGDNGRWQPYYSTVGGDTASAALANAYYPASNRGVGAVFGGISLSTLASERPPTWHRSSPSSGSGSRPKPRIKTSGTANRMRTNRRANLPRFSSRSVRDASWPAKAERVIRTVGERFFRPSLKILWRNRLPAALQVPFMFSGYYVLEGG
jgi:hypothetical protein